MNKKKIYKQNAAGLGLIKKVFGLKKNSSQSHNNSSQSVSNILSQSNDPIILLNNELNQLLQTYSSKFNSINYDNDKKSLSREYKELIYYYNNELNNNQNSSLYKLKEKLAKIRRELNDEQRETNKFITLKKHFVHTKVTLEKYLKALKNNLSNLQYTIDKELQVIKEEMNKSGGRKKNKKTKYFVGSSSSPSYNSSQRSRSRSRSSSRRTSSQRSSSQRSRSRSRSSLQRSHSHSRSSSQRSLSRSRSPSHISSLYRSVSRSRTPITPGRTPSNVSSISSELNFSPSPSPKNRSETQKTPGRYNGGKKLKKIKI